MEISPEEAYQKCPEFWDKEYAAKYVRLWQTMQPENAVEKAILDNGIGMYAICTEGENGFTYWLTEACIECAKKAGYAQLELEVVAENKTAIALYENVGFEEYGRNPKGFRSRFTGWQEVVLMRLDMDNGE